MAEVDPRDFIDMYLVEVKPTVFTFTSLTKDDFDESRHQIIFSSTVREGEVFVEFPTQMGAERLLGEWNQEIDFRRQGELNLHSAHPNDAAEVDAYLLFKPT